MTNSQQSGWPQAATATHWRVPVTGELVACSTLWLTRVGDPKDHVLEPGQHVWLDRGDDVVIEALQQQPPTLWRWQPATRRVASSAGSWRSWLSRALRHTPPSTLHTGPCTPA